MTYTELNTNLVGKKVKGVFTGLNIEGVIVEVFAERDGKKVALDDENAHCKGVRIEMTEQVQWGDCLYTYYESTQRVMPKDFFNKIAKEHGLKKAKAYKVNYEDFGNLRYTHII